MDRVSKKRRRMWTFAYFEQSVSVVWHRLFSLTFKNSKYHILGALVWAACTASISGFLGARGILSSKTELSHETVRDNELF